jgi:hypothetical protein
MKLALDAVMALVVLLTLLLLTRLAALKSMRVSSLGHRARYVLVLVCILVSLMATACVYEPPSPGSPSGIPAPQPTQCGVAALVTPVDITGQPEPGVVATVCTSPYP